MRLPLIVYLLALAIGVVALIVIAKTVGYAVFVVENSTDTVITQIKEQYGVPVNESEADVKRYINPLVVGLQYISVFAVLVVVVAIYMHTRRR